MCSFFCLTSFTRDDVYRFIHVVAYINSLFILWLIKSEYIKSPQNSVNEQPYKNGQNTEQTPYLRTYTGNKHMERYSNTISH